MRDLRENEYVRDGTIYCSVCNTPKQVMIHTKRGLLIVEPGCKCVEESRNREELRKREVIIQRNTKCCFKDYGEEQKKAYSRTLEALEDNEHVDKAKGYADHFEDFSRDGIGLLLTGGVGTGKSTIAAGIANTLLQNGYTARFTNFSYIAEDLEGLKGYEKIEKLMKLVRHRLLVIDDFGIERQTSTMKELVYKVINMCYEAKTPLIITTNIPLADFAKSTETMDERLYDRILERCHPIKMEGDSRRREAVRAEFRRREALINAN